jgi:hypothetical protein
VPDIVQLRDSMGTLLGTACVEETGPRDGPWDRQSLRYSGSFQPAPAWEGSEARALLRELDEAANDGAIGVLDVLQKKLHADGIHLTRASDGSRIPAWFILLYDGRVLEWSVELTAPGG